MLRKLLWLLLILCLSSLVSGCTMHYKEIIIREVDMSENKTKAVVSEVLSEEVKDIFPDNVGDIPVDEAVLTKEEVNEVTGEVKRVVFSFDDMMDLISKSVRKSRDIPQSIHDMHLKVLNRKEPKQLSSTPPDLPLNVGKPLSLKETLLRFGGNLKDQLTTLSQMPGMLNNVPESDVVYDFTGVTMENRAMQEMNPYFVNEKTGLTIQEAVNQAYAKHQQAVDNTLSKFTPEQIAEMVAHYESSKSSQGQASDSNVASSDLDKGSAQPEPKA